MWRGGLDDPLPRWSDDDSRKFPGMVTSPCGTLRHSAYLSCDCTGNSNIAAFAQFWDWKFKLQSDLKTEICITTSTTAVLEQILMRMLYYKVIGVSPFFIFVEVEAALPRVPFVLESIPGVKEICRTQNLEKKQASSRIWNETWLSSVFCTPFNFELFVKQSMGMAWVMARDAGVYWIIHLDTDEPIPPTGTQEYALRQLLLDVPGNVVRMVQKSSIERGDIKDPFTEAFIVVSTASKEEMLNWFREHVITFDPSLILKLSRKAILTRSHASMGLKQSGLFESIIESFSKALNATNSQLQKATAVLPYLLQPWILIPKA